MTARCGECVPGGSASNTWTASANRNNTNNFANINTSGNVNNNNNANNAYTVFVGFCSRLHSVHRETVV